MRSAILINGPPASGKTTIAKGIVATLNYPFFSIDVIKDVLFSNFGIGDRDFNRFVGSVSFQIIEKIITEFSFDSRVIIEAWFGSRIFKNVEERLNLIGINQIIEIWCHAPGVILVERYLNRVNSRQTNLVYYK